MYLPPPSSSSSIILNSTQSSNADMSTSPPVTYVPYIRRRNSPQQLKALQELFEATSHPTREQRMALAGELGMYVNLYGDAPRSDLSRYVRELKSVTNWFQNRRQTEKRKSLVWNENNSPRVNALQSHRLARRYPKRILSGSFTVSLDKIARLAERPSFPSSTPIANRTPLTPRTTNIRAQSSPRPSELWKHIPSSPAAPPSSPGAEEARLAVLPLRSKTWRSLEWACLKARRDRRTEGEDDIPSHPSLSHGDGSDDGSFEALTPALTPDSSVNFNLSPKSSFSSGFGGEEDSKSLFSDSSKCRQSEDVEAAMTLLGFMARH